LAKGLFEQRNVDIEAINFGGSTDQLLRRSPRARRRRHRQLAPALAEAAGTGFDVKIATATHGGCMRLFATKASGIGTLADVKARQSRSPTWPRRIRISSPSGWPNSESDPNGDVTFRVFPADLLPGRAEERRSRRFRSPAILWLGGARAGRSARGRQ